MRACFFCFSRALASALLIASNASLSFSLRNASKRMASSSSISSDFFSASSLACALRSSFWISSRFVSRVICTRNILCFLSRKSVMRSRSRCLLPVMADVAADTSRLVLAMRARAASSVMGMSSSVSLLKAPARCISAVFCQTGTRASSRLRSWRLAFSISRRRNSSSPVGSRNGLLPAASLEPAEAAAAAAAEPRVPPTTALPARDMPVRRPRDAAAIFPRAECANTCS
mmetsp:Transcript_16155/g.61190  ORF Transcript_16155/g.61190 Transcript_16155/m.61190 type:complete len:230 (-) Transcript_16155:74-763(-)